MVNVPRAEVGCLPPSSFLFTHCFSPFVSCLSNIPLSRWRRGSQFRNPSLGPQLHVIHTFRLRVGGLSSSSLEPLATFEARGPLQPLNGDGLQMSMTLSIRYNKTERVMRSMSALSAEVCPAISKHDVHVLRRCRPCWTQCCH